VDDDAWNPEPHGDGPPDNWPAGEVGMGLGGERDGVEVLLPRT
jgi:hypothetical protein